MNRRTTLPGGDKTLTHNEARLMHALDSVLVSRAKLMGSLGKSYGGDRDVYTACGLPKTITFNDFEARYRRQDIAQRIINAYPDATWRGVPEVYEDENPDVETEFEETFSDLAQRIRLFHYFKRTDRLAGIGRYAVLFMGFDDGEENLALPVTKASTILYLQPYSEQNATVRSVVKDTSDPRYGLPELYRCNIRNGTNEVTVERSVDVHWSRVLHVADDCDESDVYGTPRLEAVYNNLEMLLRIGCGSGEMFWRGAFQGIAFEADADADLSQTSSQLNDEIDEYIHGMKRYMRLQGVKANTLQTSIEDPDKAAELQLKLISGAKGIPVRILTGSERGELASTQDRENWKERVDERRRDFAGPVVVEQFVRRCVNVGILPEPKGEGANGYNIEWPDLDALNAVEKVDIAAKKTHAIAEFVQSGGENVMPLVNFYTEILGFSDERAQQMVDAAEEQLREELADTPGAQFRRTTMPGQVEDVEDDPGQKKTA